MRRSFKKDGLLGGQRHQAFCRPTQCVAPVKFGTAAHCVTGPHQQASAASATQCSLVSAAHAHTFRHNRIASRQQSRGRSTRQLSTLATPSAYAQLACKQSCVSIWHASLTVSVTGPHEHDCHPCASAASATQFQPRICCTRTHSACLHTFQQSRGRSK